MCLAKAWPDLVFCLAIGLLALFVRIMHLEQISCSGDPQNNWYFVRQLLSGFNFSTVQWTHHMARFGVHWVTVVVQSLFGASPFTYYIPQLLASVIATVLVYILGYKVASRTVGILAAFFFITFSPFDRASSQLRPGIFEISYVIGSVLFLLAYTQSDNQRQRVKHSIGCGVLLFLAYMTKVHCLFFIPGILIVMWRAHRNVRDLSLFLGILLALFLIETAVINIITPHSHRFEIIIDNHLRFLEERKIEKFDTIWDLTIRFTKRLKDDWKLQVYGFFASSVIVLAWRRKRKEEAAIIVTASFLFFFTFLVRDFDPIRLYLKMIPRYLTVAMPYIFVINAIVLSSAARSLVERVPICDSMWRRFGRLIGPIVVAAAILALGFYTYEKSKDNLERHPFIEVARLQSLFNDTYRRKLPIVAEYDQRPTRAVSKPLYWAKTIFINDELLLRDGVLPEFVVERDVKRIQGKKGFIPNIKELTRSKVRHMLKHNKECVLILKRRRMRFVKTSTSEHKLPDHCKTP